MNIELTIFQIVSNAEVTIKSLNFLSKEKGLINLFCKNFLRLFPSELRGQLNPPYCVISSYQWSSLNNYIKLKYFIPDNLLFILY